MEKYADPETAAAALARLAKNQREIDSWMMPTATLIRIAASMAPTYIARTPEESRAFLLSLTDIEARACAVEALSWQMVGTNGSDAQREFGRAFKWAEGWANN